MSCIESTFGQTRSSRLDSCMVASPAEAELIFVGTERAPQFRRLFTSMATPDGKGYWLVGSDGGVFSFGDASVMLATTARQVQ